jgi:hypothetical protein
MVTSVSSHRHTGFCLLHPPVLCLPAGDGVRHHPAEDEPEPVVHDPLTPARILLRGRTLDDPTQGGPHRAEEEGLINGTDRTVPHPVLHEVFHEEKAGRRSSWAPAEPIGEQANCSMNLIFAWFCTPNATARAMQSRSRSGTVSPSQHFWRSAVAASFLTREYRGSISSSRVVKEKKSVPVETPTYLG